MSKDCREFFQRDNGGSHKKRMKQKKREKIVSSSSWVRSVKNPNGKKGYLKHGGQRLAVQNKGWKNYRISALIKTRKLKNQRMEQRESPWHDLRIEEKRANWKNRRGYRRNDGLQVSHTHVKIKPASCEKTKLESCKRKKSNLGKKGQPKTNVCSDGGGSKRRDREEKRSKSRKVCTGTRDKPRPHLTLGGTGGAERIKGGGEQPLKQQSPMRKQSRDGGGAH